MECLFINCGHSSKLNLCSFRQLPSDDCGLKIWKRNAKISQRKIDSSENACICSCHFEGQNNHPTHILHRLTKRNNEEVGSFKGGPEKKCTKTEHDLGDINYLNNLVDDLLGECNTHDDEEIEDNRVEIADIACVQVVDLHKTNNLTLACSPITSSSVVNPTREALQAENYQLKLEIEGLNRKMVNLNLRFEMEFIEDSKEKVFAHTGLPSKEVFDIVYDTLMKVPFDYAMGWEVVNIPKRSQLLMTLMKLRMDLRHFDLAQRFMCSETTVSNVFRTWVLLMHEILFLQLMKHIPSRWKNKECLPAAFEVFSDCRIVLDCTDMFTDKPLKMNRQKAIFSSYKHHATLKPLIGIAPNGLITYASEFYPGSCSDKKIVCALWNQPKDGCW